MVRKVGMVHSVAGLAPMFNDLARELMPGVEVVHLADEGLLKEILATETHTPKMARRFAAHANFAADSGAEIVMLTCSSLGPLIEMSQNLVDVPMLKVDEAMADEAARLGKRIGIIATAHSTLKPTSDLIKQRAALAGKKVEIETAYCEGAFPALQRGDAATHDKMVKEKLADLQKRVDVIILAQASVARVVAQIPDSEKKVPILSSPRLGVQRLKERLESLGKK